MDTIHVSAAVILNKNKVLLVKRAPGQKNAGSWEFPGGKLEKDEKYEECLVREIKEELDVHISAGKLCTESKYEYDEYKIIMRSYYCVILSGEPKLSVHDEIKWVQIDEVLNYKLSPADFVIAKQVISNSTIFDENKLNASKINAETIDKWVEAGWEWGTPVSHDEYTKAKNGKWDVVLTPKKPVPHSWFPDFKNSCVLGLASGGGQQMPIFNALGAKCTVMDYSPRQLDNERLVAKRESYDIELIQGDMTKSFPFEDESFDLIFHPVSNCYIKDVQHVWNECYRVLKPGGILLAGTDNSINFIFDEEETDLKVKYSLPFDPLINKEHYQACLAFDSGMQFSHTLTEQIGGQLKAGFVLADIYEDTNSEGKLAEMNINSYIATKSIKYK